MSLKLCNNITRYSNSIYGDDDDTNLIGSSSGEPYVVLICGNHYIPISILIFANSEDDAKNRIVNYLKKVIDENIGDFGGGYCTPKEKALKILKEIEDGYLEIKTEKFDKRYLAKIPWACNDQLL